jgi:hypothetical protein
VLERGAIISEFPTGFHPAPENFPLRNRIKQEQNWTGAEDVPDERPTPVGAAFVPAEAVPAEQPNLLLAGGLTLAQT